MVANKSNISGKPIAQANPRLQQVVENGAKPTSRGGNPPAQSNPNLGQTVIKAPKIPPKQK